MTWSEGNDFHNSFTLGFLRKCCVVSGVCTRCKTFPPHLICV